MKEIRFCSTTRFGRQARRPIEELRAKPGKAAYLHGIYARMRRGIVVHPEYVGPKNIELLREMQFVFLCLDRGPAKKLIVERLEEFGIPFIDGGMGVYATDNMQGGVLRVTTSTPEQRDHFRSRVPLSDSDEHNEYARNIQIADLNALNAALAVIKWKEHFGFYLDLDREQHCTYTIDGNTLTNEDRRP